MEKRTAFIVSLVTVLVVAAASVALAFSLRDRAKVTEEEAGEEAAWSGMDESVVETFAAEHGREARGPVLPLEEGDILLFLFCLGGFLAGVVVGYLWRRILGESPGKEEVGAA
ncbi:hypothetical protein [Candidatus Solincola tengchongensis]|uniref:hypothetical protein n=1 Tax=Candidatus Solincola tengchongensis TaxID=2900693 RepID=UPI00257B8873|nr:hypothetical protein [Candidatus Solincola tengchongensis]